MRIRGPIRFIVAALAIAAFAGGASAQGGAEQTQSTAHYKIVLAIGPVTTMLMPGQESGAKEGEVMVHMPGMPMAMGTTDQGKPVNHHLEVHIYDKATGTLVTKTMPKVMFTNQATGESRALASVVAMYDVKEGRKDLHFGSNLFLPDGKYTVRVVVGGETVVFKVVDVTGQK